MLNGRSREEVESEIEDTRVAMRCASRQMRRLYELDERELQFELQSIADCEEAEAEYFRREDGGSVFTEAVPND